MVRIVDDFIVLYFMSSFELQVLWFKGLGSVGSILVDVLR